MCARAPPPPSPPCPQDQRTLSICRASVGGRAAGERRRAHARARLREQPPHFFSPSFRRRRFGRHEGEKKLPLGPPSRLTFRPQKKHPISLRTTYLITNQQRLKPEYAKAATAVKAFDDTVVIGKVDATVEPEMAKKFGVSGYPTLKWFVDGELVSDYGGPRES